MKYEQSENIGLIRMALGVQKNLRLQESEFISKACGHKTVGHEEMKLSCFQRRGVLKNTKTQNILPRRQGKCSVEQFLEAIRILISKLFL